MGKELKKIIWPIDPYVDNIEGDQSVVDFLVNWGQYEELLVSAVYVSSSLLPTALPFSSKGDRARIQTFIQEDVESHLRKIGASDLCERVDVLDNFDTSRSSEVFRLEKYIEIEDPDYVILSTHGREGVGRVFWGSFAENFLRRTDVPSFVIRKGMHCKGNLTRALLPLSMDAASEEFIKVFMDRHDLSFIEDLELFYKLPIINIEHFSWVPEVWGGVGIEMSGKISADRLEATKYFDALLTHPLSQKRLRYNLGAGVDSVESAILREIREQESGFVIMRSQAGPIERRIFGSFTKDVVRHSTVPVLVYPYHFKTETQGDRE